jgi:hypothetical protein
MPNLYAAAADQAFVKENAFLTQPSQGLTVRDVINDILLLWGVSIPFTADKSMLRRAIHDMNAGLQIVWALAKDDDYFSRITLTLTFAASQSQQTLPENVLTILGPARFATSGQPLRPITNRSQFDSYGPIFLGQLGFAVPNAMPQAFFIEKLNSPTPDDVISIFHIVPAPTASTSFLLDVSTEAPRYVWNDYETATPVQFPHKYVDSVLLPICRYKAMTSYLLPNPDVKPSLVADYQSALRLIGAVDPSMKEVEFADRSTDK